MATTYEAAQATGERAKAMLGDMNERAKGAMEKGAKFAEEMTEFHKGNFEAMAASGRVVAKGVEELAQDAAETARKNFEAMTSSLKGITAVRSPTELFQLQGEFAKSAFDTAVADASRFSEKWMKLAGDVAQPLSNRFAVAAEKVKAAAL